LSEALTEAPLTGDALVYAQILADMRDGVLTLDLAGQIITFNAAAGQLLGLDPAAVIGRTYAELFLTEAAYEPLNDLVLEAIYDPSTTHTRELELQLEHACPTMLVRTTLLRGPVGPRGVIVVLSDLSEQRKRRKLKRLFGAYVDPRIVARLLEQADRIGAGTWETATIAFVDLVGFTRLCELLGPSDVVRFLNAYLEEMAGPIDAHDGVTDKYMGDGIMAFWTPGFAPGGDPAVLACRAALDQRRALERLRFRMREELALPAEAASVEIRCGIATGEVLAGSIGSARSRSYTVIGDAVNVAARLEAANKVLGTHILVAEATRERAGDEFRFRAHGKVELPGRGRPESVFELEGER
jgi:PAS domain S-box-containing protein